MDCMVVDTWCLLVAGWQHETFYLCPLCCGICNLMMPFHLSYAVAFLSPLPQSLYKIIIFDYIVLKFFWLHNFTGEKPYKIEVFEDNLYVSTYQSNNIIKLNKFGYGDLIYLMRGLNRASDILIVQENKQTKNSKFISMSLFTRVISWVIFVSLLIFWLINHYKWFYIHLFITLTMTCLAGNCGHQWVMLQWYKREELR
jgi:hypothetical protein